MTEVKINRLVKRFEGQAAVAGVSLEIGAGELFTLLGPSGCGKTTLLRMIAGFYNQDEGTIHFGERRIDPVPPHERDTGMVFQNYAVFPHLSVFDNVAYGLRARKVAGAELSRRVEEALAMVKLEAYGKRNPSQLSGGQQQRVALARALVIRPKVLLMDEPLSNLDAKLRLEMRSEIRRLQQELGITTIYVTHDQEEALAISDRIAVMNQGVVEQVGAPREIYLNPATAFVAGFIGTSNFLTGRLAGGNFYLGDLMLPLGHHGRDGAATLAVRPEGLVLGGGAVRLSCSVLEATFMGNSTQLIVGLAGGSRLELRLPSEQEPPAIGAQVEVGFLPRSVALFDPSGGVL